jgi:peroxiredoxin
MFDADTAELVKQGVGTGGPQPGEAAPDFELPDQLGRTIKLSDLCAKGPVVVSFYRGGWCPYCNLELRALQMCLPQIEALGASLIAISPQLPDESMSTAEKNELSFPVLSDVGNAIARQYGLVFELSEELRPAYQEFGIDLPATNGSDSFELPVPGTYIVDGGGVIRLREATADYKQRAEPEELVNALQTL